MEGGLVPADDAVGLVAGRVDAAGVGRGGTADLLEALLGALAGLVGDVGVVDGSLEAGGDVLLVVVVGHNEMNGRMRKVVGGVLRREVK